MNTEPCVWWNVCKVNRRLRYACCLIIRLLSGCSALRVYTDLNITRSERICKCCLLNELEDVNHFLMRCSLYNDERKMLMSNIKINVCNETAAMFDHLSELMTFFILLGMDYNIVAEDLFVIRSISAYFVKQNV